MKGILEFKLPEEQEDFKLAQEGVMWKLVVSDLIDFLRNETKHKDHSAEEYAIFDMVLDRLYEEIKDRNLSMW
jgi:hemerythrin-like domain-containing protein